MQFQGFSPRSIQYLHDVRANNSKIWYEEHKADYAEYIKKPFFALVEDLTPTVREIDPLIVTEPPKCLSHIYRDVRFVRDKMFYRDSAWVSLRRPHAGGLEGPTFFVEIMSDGFHYGMGAYDNSPKFMQAMRQYINRDPETFAAAVKSFEKNGLLVFGEKYKKPQYDFSEHAEKCGLTEWFQLKNFYISSSVLPHEAAYSPEIVSEIISDFRAAAPFYRLMFEIDASRVETDVSVPRSKRADFEW